MTSPWKPAEAGNARLSAIDGGVGVGVLAVHNEQPLGAGDGPNPNHADIQDTSGTKNCEYPSARSTMCAWAVQPVSASNQLSAKLSCANAAGLQSAM